MKNRAIALASGIAMVLGLVFTGMVGTTPEQSENQTDNPEQELVYIGPELPEYEILDKWDIMAEAFIPVESSGNPLAVNRSSGACGILQFKKIMVDEVNRLLNLKLKTKDVTYYTYDDRFDRHKSVQMFKIVMMYKNKSGSLDRAMRIWNHTYTEREKSMIRANYARLLSGKSLT